MIRVSMSRVSRESDRHTFTSLRLPRCVSTGPVVVRLAGMANERERERSFDDGFWDSNLYRVDPFADPDAISLSRG